MGRFEDKLAAGMSDPEFAEGYAEAKAELAASESPIVWQRCEATVLTVTAGVTNVSVSIEAPAIAFSNFVVPQIMGQAVRA